MRFLGWFRSVPETKHEDRIFKGSTLASRTRMQACGVDTSRPTARGGKAFKSMKYALPETYKSCMASIGTGKRDNNLYLLVQGCESSDPGRARKEKDLEAIVAFLLSDPDELTLELSWALVEWAHVVRNVHFESPEEVVATLRGYLSTIGFGGTRLDEASISWLRRHRHQPEWPVWSLRGFDVKKNVRFWRSPDLPRKGEVNGRPSRSENADLQKEIDSLKRRLEDPSRIEKMIQEATEAAFKDLTGKPLPATGVTTEEVAADKPVKAGK